eukprot:7607006-Pyramimonas_sp.AAC.1
MMRADARGRPSRWPRCTRGRPLSKGSPRWPPAKARGGAMGGRRSDRSRPPRVRMAASREERYMKRAARFSSAPPPPPPRPPHLLSHFLPCFFPSGKKALHWRGEDSVATLYSGGPRGSPREEEEEEAKGRGAKDSMPRPFDAAVASVCA